MNLLSRLFGKAAPAAAEPVLHKDYKIFPKPISEGGVFRVAARVEKEVGGQVRVHQLIRADTSPSLDEAISTSVAKAKQAIDQLGDAIFG
jgi:hypothetical protein